VEPVQIQQGRYLMPEKPGFSIEIREESLEQYSFPDGEVWNAPSSNETISAESGR
jgi:L-fuconate dehydratase